MFKKLIFFVIYSAFAIVSLANDVIVLNSNLNIKKIGSKIYYYIDADKALSYNNVIEQSFQKEFVKSNKDIPFFDYQNYTVWLKFTIHNNTESENRFFLIIDYPLLYKIRLYVPHNDGIDTLFSGDGYKFSKRSILHTSNIFELNLSPGNTQTYYCAVKSDGDVITLPISISSPEYFYEKSETRPLFLGFFYGILVLVVLLNLFFYFSMRDFSFLYYVLFTFSIGVFLFIRDGYAFKYFWPSSPAWANLSVVLFSMLSIISVMLLIKSVLQTRKNFPVFDKILVAFIIITSILSISAVFSQSMYRFMISFGNIITAVTTIVCIVIAILARRKKIYFTKYFIAALFFIIIGGVWVVMKNAGIPGIFQFEHGMKFATAIVLLILAYGMTKKFTKLLNQSKQEAINRLEEINLMKERANILLEEEVKKRTHELNESYKELHELNQEILTQKEEIESQNNAIQIQRDIAIQQKEHIEKQNIAITNSINYAKRIQQALLSEICILSECQNGLPGISECFVMFKPKEIVSGDFYYATRFNDKLIIAVADCTGHGVPGGFMSMLGISFLNEIINIAHNLDAKDIVHQLRDNVTATLLNAGKKDKDDYLLMDGMNIAIVIIDLSKKILQYSGAFNPIILVRDNNLHCYTLDRQAIGIFIKKKKDFHNYNVDLKDGDMVYIYSDGFIDQFDEEGSERFKVFRFQELLLSINELPAKEQKEKLDEVFHKWKGSNDQIDDVTVLGFRV
ncbi:MAG: SpoIIE family protein phosphatase [Bacteroidetes bacterium]|nr:SpoIIE family protein phosphatase [Bacteroidota bacterium]